MDIRAVEAHVDSVLQVFTLRRPDWKDYEPQIVAVGQRVLPNGLAEMDYLDMLYLMAKSSAAASLCPSAK